MTDTRGPTGLARQASGEAAATPSDAASATPDRLGVPGEPSADDDVVHGPLPGEILPEQIPPEKRHHAGRDLPAAIAVGVVLGAIVVVSLFVYRPMFGGVLAVVSLVGVGELCRSMARTGIHPPVWPLAVGAVATVAVTWWRGTPALAIAFLLTVLAVLVWRVHGGTHGYLRDVSAGVFIAIYVPLLAGFAVLLAIPDDGARRVVLYMGTVVASDVGGYVAGVLFGRHRLAPSISPGKSWEGLAGSLLACTGTAVGFFLVWFGGPWWKGVVFGVAMALTATIGDLIESTIKRDLRVKDMGNLLPGHGGVMDRLDSMLPGAAVAFALISVLVS